MKNIKLYEDFSPENLPDFGDVLNGISHFFPQSQDEISDPKEYVINRLTYSLKNTKNPKSKTELFKEIVKHLKKEGYDYVSFPRTEGFDFERVERAYLGLDYTHEFDKGMNNAICLPVNNQGQKHYFLLEIQNEKTLFILFKDSPTIFLIDYKTSNQNKTLDLVFYVNGKLHTGTFELEEITPGDSHFEVDPVAIYYSTKSSDGKKYELSTPIDHDEYRSSDRIVFTNDYHDLTEVTSIIRGYR